MAYDSLRGVTVLFGGKTHGPGGLNGETWEWNGTEWLLKATTGPAARWQHQMCYDAHRGVTVLFGGEAGLAEQRDTWEWNGKDWQLVSNEGPERRKSHTLVYDSHHRESVLFGGRREYSGSYAEYGDIWSWNGTQWILRSQLSIGRRIYHAMAYDNLRRRSILFGGYNGFNHANDTRALWLLAPGIIVEPHDTVAKPGTTVVLAVDVEGTTPMQFQWRRNGVPLTDGAQFLGVNTAELTIQPVVPPLQGSYDVVVNNECGNISTTPIELTVALGPDINQDGTVNVYDLLAVITDWGTCSLAQCDTDIAPLGGDGVVNTMDLLLVISNWG